MSDTVLQTVALSAMHWPTIEPFLFCANHDDLYPAGDAQLGPAASLDGRKIGSDFAGKDGWRMYHGSVVPGFPRHPHRGFETVTLCRSGLIDHSDSLGATARFGPGDVQWMTAGRGIVHSEMFPLVNQDAGNPTGLFQIWLNLPRANKMVEPHFSMMWDHTIPRYTHTDAAGRQTVVRVIAGALFGKEGPPSPPKSWAADPRAELAIWTIDLAAGARWTLPAASPRPNRTLYFHGGSTATIAGDALSSPTGLVVRPDRPVEIVAGDEPVEILMLQACPIGEPVVQHGPFVMNTRDEIRQAFADYQRTGFGGWPWTRDDPVHDRGAGRFAVHADGRKETVDS